MVEGKEIGDMLWSCGVTVMTSGVLSFGVAFSIWKFLEVRSFFVFAW